MGSWVPPMVVPAVSPNFKLVSAVRSQVEPTSRWTQWVKSIHPTGATLNEPTPRKVDPETTKTDTVPDDTEILCVVSKSIIRL